MLLWLSWLPATVVATSADGANVFGGYQNITVSPIFDSCSAVGENCIDSGCCHEPGYTCMHSVKHPKVAMCRRRETPCADTEEWLCPRGDQCTPIFQDCRSTLCCQKAKYFKGAKDVPFECVRRPHLYYAQCRPVYEPDARHTTGSIVNGQLQVSGGCTDSSEWLCPGWERCAAPFGECTRSRCCADTGFSCFLNGTALASGAGWHAYCRPANETWAKLQLDDDLSKEERCDELAAHGWLCPSVWRRHVHEAAALAKWYVDEEPAAVAGVAVASTLACLVACACCIIHRRRAKRTLSRLNAEINAVRDGMHEAKLKKSGGGEAERLNLAIDGVSEREPDLPLAPMAANAMVGGPAGVSLSRLDDVTPAGGPADGVAAPADSAEDDFPPGVAIGAAAAEARAAAAIPLAGPPEERCSNPVDELARIRAKFARSAPEAPPPLVAPTLTAATAANPDVQAAAAFYGKFAIDTGAAAAADPAAVDAALAADYIPNSTAAGLPPQPSPALQQPARPRPTPTPSAAANVDERSHVVRALQALESRKKPAPPARKRPDSMRPGSFAAR